MANTFMENLLWFKMEFRNLTLFIFPDNWAIGPMLIIK